MKIKKKKKKSGAGRPSKGFDLDLIEKLAAIHCKNTEIASVIGCDSSLLTKPNYSKIIEKGKERGKQTLRRKMYETAMNGNIVMMIWLSKQYLGMSEKMDQKTQISTIAEPVQVIVYKNGSEAQLDKPEQIQISDQLISTKEESI